MDNRARHFQAILENLGYTTNGACILDFGCGAGLMVKAFSRLGLEAYGSDIRPRDDVGTEQLICNGIIRLMEPPDYRIPFEDNKFDFVTSDQVFEHVQDYDQALLEIARVLKPNGASLHIFPSRYKIIEPHQYVPFGTIIHSRIWLRLWAAIGIRNAHQRGLSASEVVERNYRFLIDRTNYLPKRRIFDHFARRFETVRFVESEFLAHSKRGKVVYAMSRFPLLGSLPGLYSTLQSRVIFASIPRASLNS